MPIADAPVTLGSFDITPQFEHRARWERRIDRDFFEPRSDNVTDLQFRTRLGFTAKQKNGGKLTVRWQLGYGEALRPSGDTVTHNSDLTIFNWEQKFGDWNMVLGRQTYILGNAKLVSSSTGWGNLGRTFEGLRLNYKDWEFAGFKEATNTPSNKQMSLGLVSNKNELGLSSLIYRVNERPVLRSETFTLNHIYSQKISGFDFSLEGSAQWGKNEGRDHAAWALTARVEKEVSKTLNAFAEANLVSGGSGPKSGTFDQLYQNPEPSYGMRSLIGYRNLRELTLGAEWQATDKIKFEGKFNVLGLQDNKDAWYGMNGSANRHGGGAFVDPTGNSGGQVGRAIQLEAFYTPTKRDTFATGIGIFQPGAFITRRVGGNSTNQVWGYFLYQFKF